MGGVCSKGNLLDQIILLLDVFEVNFPFCFRILRGRVNVTQKSFHLSSSLC